MKLLFSAVTLCTVLFSQSTLAHFQLLYAPELVHDRGGPLTLKMPFSHPGSNGHVMATDKPESLLLIRRGKTADLTSSITASTWSGANNTAKSWQADVRLKGLGDYVFVLTPAPYLEASEDAYIQQLTKVIYNVGGLPTDWAEDQGLKAEIVPLQAPYQVYAGGTFSGIVKSEGEPVPFAEIEIEYMNYVPDMQADSFADQPLHAYPGEHFETLTLIADANGTFTFGVPKAGFWGFAALGVGTDTEYQGKELSQDAVLWIQAKGFQ